MTNSYLEFFRAPYRTLRARLLEKGAWKRRCYAAPSPSLVKKQVLLRNAIPNGTWVETGTFLGETTSFLAAHSTQVYSLEPAVKLYDRAVRKFANKSNVKIINGPSETIFPSLLPNLHGAVNFWLDGHYSAGNTYQGEKDTPIIEELLQIEANIGRFCGLCVLVDDVRCFDPTIKAYETYPSIDFLVDWARRNGLKWHIEHDIFVAKSQI
jgi:hypothetical protein